MRTFVVIDAADLVAAMQTSVEIHRLLEAACSPAPEVERIAVARAARGMFVSVSERLQAMRRGPAPEPDGPKPLEALFAPLLNRRNRT